MKIPTIDDFEEVAITAGRITRTHYEAEDGVTEWKEDGSPVTSADKAVHDYAVAYFQGRFPEIPIIGEEGCIGECDDPDRPKIRMDEMDGTGAFLLRVPVFAPMFALETRYEPVISSIGDPFSGKPFLAEKGKGAYRGGKKLSVQKAPPHRKAVAISSWPDRDKNPNLVENMYLGPGGIGKYLQDQGIRVYQAGAIGYFDARVASGEFCGSIFPGGLHHDTIAGDLLVREAGGITSDLAGKPLDYSKKNVFGHVFGAPGVHSTLLSVLNRRT